MAFIFLKKLDGSTDIVINTAHIISMTKANISKHTFVTATKDHYTSIVLTKETIVVEGELTYITDKIRRTI